MIGDKDAWFGCIVPKVFVYNVPLQTQYPGHDFRVEFRRVIVDVWTLLGEKECNE